MTNAFADSFKTEVLDGLHNFAGAGADVFKLLLIKPGATGVYDKTLTNVGTPGSSAPSSSNVGTDEVANGSGYVSGGVTLSGVSVALFTDTATVDWTVDPSWSGATFAAIGAVIYNSSQSGRVVAVLDFGGTVTATNGNFTVQLPVAGASTATIRLT